MQQEGKAQELEGRSILVVEDCFDQARLYMKTLVGVGAKVTWDCDGSSGYKTFVDLANTLDLVIVELDMPEMNGMQMTQLIRATGHNVPIIGMTAYDPPGLEYDWKAAGCSVLIRKPFKMDELISISRVVLFSNYQNKVDSIH